MIASLLKLVEKYKTSKEDLTLLEQYSLLLHDELQEEIEGELSIFLKNYTKIASLSSYINKYDLSFDLSNNKITILKDQTPIMTNDLFSVNQIFGFLNEEELTDDQISLAKLFLSNTESVILCNLAMRSIDLDKI